ncbi:MAG: hypothetical protein Fur005_29380 [Roseiflexaceae bacterium]
MPVPLISILLPTYNRADYLASAVESVLHQTFSDFELIIVDDGSTDQTSMLLDQFRDPRIRRFYQQNRGISAALNTALHAARGQYLSIQNSDDYWLPTLLDRLYQPFVADPALGVAYGRCQAIDAQGHVLARMAGVPPRYPGQMFRSLLYGDHLCTIAVLMRRGDVLHVGGWDEQLIASEDWDLWLRLAQFRRFAYVDQTLAYFREHPGRTTSTASARFTRLVADRVRVLDKLYAMPNLPAVADSMRSLAYANLAIDIGLRWLKIGNWRASLQSFGQALAIGPRPLALLARIMTMVGMQMLLRNRHLEPWGIALMRLVGQWRRRRRTNP